MDAATIQKLADAADLGKKKSLNFSLGCSNASDISGLHPSPKHAVALLEAWQSVLEPAGVSPLPFQTWSSVQLFQALLMIYPRYETPWRAILSLTSRIRELPIGKAFSCISIVEKFFDETTTSFSTLDVMNLEDYLRQFVLELRGQLFNASLEHRELVGSLLRSTLRLSSFCLKPKTYQGIYQQIVEGDISVDSFSVWLEMIRRIHDQLPGNLLDLARDRAMAFLKQHGGELGLLSCCDSLDISFVIGGNSVAWYKLALCMLSAIASRTSDFILLERHAEARLRRLSLKEFNKFYEIYESEAVSPEWVRFSIMLLLHRCNRESTAVLSTGLFSTPRRTDITLHYRFLDILFPDDELKGELELSGDQDDQDQLLEVLWDLDYVNEGLIADSNGKKIYTISRATKIMLGVIKCGLAVNLEFESQETSEAASKRRTGIFLAATTFLTCCEGFGASKAMLSFAVCAATVYNYSTTDRVGIVQFIQHGLECRSKNHTTQNSCVAALSLIMGSVRRVDFKEDAASFLEPCSRLLDARNRIETLTFMQISSSLAREKCTREVLFEQCKVFLSRTQSQSWDDDNDGTATTHYRGFGVRAALFGLLLILRSDSWGDLEREAWCIFSDCLVLNKPPIKVLDRKWLYEQITESLLDCSVGKTYFWQCHFLRAIVARLGTLMVQETYESSIRFVPGNCFIVWDDVSAKTSQTVQIEDVANLLRLAFALLFHVYSGSDQAPPSKNEAMSWEALLCLFRNTGPLKQANRHERSIIRIFQKWLDEPDQEYHVVFVTLLSCVTAVFHNLLLFVAQDNDNSNEYDEGKTILERGFNRLVEQEIEDLDIAVSNHYPCWLQGTGCDLFGSREVDVDEEWIFSLYSSLCDVLIECICVHFPLRLPAKNKSLSIYSSIVLGTGNILELKQSLSANGGSISTDVHSGPGPRATANMYMQFFLAASRSIENAVQEEISLEKTGQYTEATKLFCDSIISSSDERMVGFWTPLVQSIWALYQVISSEKGATRFITYMESNLKDEKKSSRTDASICSLKSIRSSEDVDESIRRIRVFVLKALDRCIGFATQSNLEIDPLNGEDDEVNWAGFVGGICRELCHDLHVGLAGESGGITTELYGAYLRTMQTCLNSVDLIARQNDAGLPPGTVHFFGEVIGTLGDILQSYPVEDAILFRSTLIMALAEFPSVAQLGARNTNTKFALEKSKAMLDSLFDDCFFLLERWSAIRDPNTLPWEDIAGSKHTSNGLETSLQRRVARVDRVELQLRTKEIWSWALSCIFVALEMEWHQSFLRVVSAQQNASGTVELSETVIESSADLGTNLKSGLVRASKLFCSSTAEGQGATLDILAMNLPSAPRIRFCHMLAAFAKVLKFCIDYVASYLSSEVTERKGTFDSKVGFVEATTVLTAWVSFDDTQKDFTVGIFRWLSILRRKLRPGTHRAKYVDTQELLPWVSRLALLIRELPPSLRRLLSAFKTDGCLGGDADLFLTIFPGGPRMMTSLLKRKLDVLESVIPSDYAASSLPDFPSINPPQKVLARKKKSKHHRSQSRPRKKSVTPIPRSRNSIVNAFMNLDRKSLENEGDQADAFVDLEDFLVEG